MINNRKIVITGASSGIGFETLRLLARGAGNRILAVSRHAEQLLSTFADNVIPFNADISSAAGVDSVFEKALAKYEKEQHIIEALLAGKTTLEIYGFDRLIEEKTK